MKRTLFGMVAGAVMGYAVKHWMDRKVFQEQDDLICTYEEMIMGTDDGLEDVTRKYPPSIVWICDHCESLMMFHDSKENMERHIDEIKDCDGLYCVECGELNEIDPVTKHILNTKLPR